MQELQRIMSEIVKKNGNSLRALADKLQIERSLFLKMLNGTRNMSVGQFEEMLTALNVNREQEERLREAYMAVCVGDDELDTYRRFISHIAALHNEKKDSAVSVQIRFDRSKQAFRMDTKHEIAIMMEYILQTELEKNPKDRRLYSNISVHVMRSICRKYPQADGEKWDFRLVLDGMEKENHGPDFLSCMIELMMLGYSASFQDGAVAEQGNSPLYRYVMVSSDCVLMTDYECKTGFMQISRPLADGVAAHFLGKYTRTKPVMKSLPDILSLAGAYMPFLESGNADFVSIENFCCVPQYCPKEMWERIAKKEAPDREKLIEYATSFYSVFMNSVKRKKVIVSRQGIDRFAADGILMTMPVEFANRLEPPDRITILERMYTDLTSKKNSLCLFDENIHMQAGYCCIEMITSDGADSILIVSTQIESMPLHYVGNLSIFVYEPDTIKGFLKYAECLPASVHCMRQEDSVRYLRSTIEKLKATLPKKEKE